MNRLLASLSYLRIKHGAKIWFDVIYPLLFAVTVGGFLTRTSLRYDVVGEGGLVDTFNGMLALLVGFFIAALAAVAAFDRPGMDQTMRGDGATLDIRGRGVPLRLTRRMFVGLLFGYLTFVTLTAYLLFSVANVVLADASPQTVGLTVEQYAAARAAFIYAYCFVLGHVASHALLGVYYLCWRIIIVDPEIIDGSGKEV